MNHDPAEQLISIDRLAFGGSGVGRIDGKVCFVPFACPGDELLVRITAEKRSYLTARIISIVTPGQDRITPPCPLFGSCGGCSWQHIAYHRQLEEKRRIFADALWRGARAPGELVADVVASPLTYGYRSRVQFKLHGAGPNLRIGFYRQGTHFVEDAGQGCPIALPVINRILGSLREMLPAFPDPTKIPQINLECAEKGAVVIVNYIGDDHQGAKAFFRERAAQLEQATALYLQTGRKSTLQKVFGDDLLQYSQEGESSTAPACSLTYRPGGFAQVNAAQNSALLRLVREFADCRRDDQILDLYCGNGNFSLPLARGVAAVTGIEEYGDSIAAARHNARLNGITNVEFICADAAAGAGKLMGDGRRFPTIILDPPRSGAADLLEHIPRLGADKIIYISCDPSTLARDCGVLFGKGYTVVSSVPVDMFPQTFHLESVTLLRRRNGAVP
ncbi:23S rRNA (uracil(1939)-C(5))-methyltransferase RlmD [Pelobacter propionicus]|uniref:23S rRNA m(5)U-1939 methyltransferase n=1 Tax=Pelobacter propionicus (strain DSM 2379 / NBRC 103807 / OttBd1) TaxID=338966 RepID=A1APX5_PELPD|nr:23S rRNA (uracil(1939)-C(5))-methyltransferase RlmD [Pelobacter propionicus]ABK99395.1 23S rRNA m(5)U-1939 methyltransferase [Pelobacter propionicus DSM 2379]